MDNRTNTIAGWLLFAGVVSLGAWIVSGEHYAGEEVKTAGYELPGGEVAGAVGVAAKPVEFYLAQADVAKGEAVFKKCAACHVDVQGGANGIGPNLWAVVGEPIGKGAGGYAFSSALSGVGGNWDFKSLDHWLTSPRAFAPGTKMTFAGLGDPQDRANVIAYLNAHGTNLPLPAAPAEAAAPAAGDKAAPAAGNAASPAAGDAKPVAGGETTEAMPPAKK